MAGMQFDMGTCCTLALPGNTKLVSGATRSCLLLHAGAAAAAHWRCCCWYTLSLLLLLHAGG